MLTFRIRGQVREAETLAPLAGYLVKAFDKDLLFDDLLGTAVTDASGAFDIVTESEDFRELFAARPDIYMKVFGPDRAKIIYTSEHAVRCRAGRLEVFDVRVPRASIGGGGAERRLRFVADDGTERTDFDVGEPLTVSLAGLQPSAPHEIVVTDGDGRVLLVDHILSNRHGAIEPTVIWPQIGIEDPGGGARLHLDEARARWKGRRLGIAIGRGERVVARSEIQVAGTFERPVLFSADKEGRLLNGFVVGEQDAVLAVHEAPLAGDVRVFMVPRQHDWHPGDRFRPVRLAGGRPAWVDVRGVEPRRAFLARVARARELDPGAYDFIVRPVRYGYEDEDDFVLRGTDLVASRRSTGLVVRKEFMASKFVRGGCSNIQREIACRSISGQPYIQYTNTFQVGEDVYAAIDPGAVDPQLTGKMVGLYVVNHKSASQWTADNSLQHLAALGGNSAVQKFLTQSYCVNANKRLLWPNASIVGEYDVVVDYGNGNPDPAQWATNDRYDMPQDIIDGYASVGFRVVPDPTTEANIPGTIIDDLGVTWNNHPVKASVYFPADIPNATAASQISTRNASYPLVVVVHGMGADDGYMGYEYLLPHFAANGFIAASIYCGYNMKGTGRARVLFHHLTRLRAMFGARAQNTVGVMGHSRGGEAVAIAARLNQQENLGHGLRALISLAPTDQYTSERLGGAWATPYLVMYGSLDGDVASVSNNGFRLYDRASGAEKSMLFVYGAIHDRFNRVWGDGDLSFGKLGPNDLLKVISADAHEKIAKGYMAAFFRKQLLADDRWDGMFRGEWVPAAAESADTKAKFFVQYQHPGARTVDDFEGAHSTTSWQTSSINGTVDDGNSLPVDPVENELRTIDPHSPHDTGGLALQWDGTTDRIRFDLPAPQSVGGFAALSFRVTQKVDSTSNTPGQVQDLRVTLRDSGGRSRAILVSKFGTIPPPDTRDFNQYTKSAMCTVRVPMAAFTIRCLGVEEVDLAQVESVTFEFSERARGEIAIDVVQFTA